MKATGSAFQRAIEELNLMDSRNINYSDSLKDYKVLLSDADFVRLRPKTRNDSLDS